MGTGSAPGWAPRDGPAAVGQGLVEALSHNRTIAGYRSRHVVAWPPKRSLAACSVGAAVLDLGEPLQPNVAPHGQNPSTAEDVAGAVNSHPARRVDTPVGDLPIADPIRR